MEKQKGWLQKSALVFAGISFVLVLVSGVFLYLKSEELGFNDPVSASFLASIFFFISVGIVLSVIGLIDMPNFRFDKEEKEK